MSTPVARFRMLTLGLILPLALSLNVPSALAQTPACDRACLTGLVDDYLEAMLDFDSMALPGSIEPLPWADKVSFTENDIGLMIGDGLWGSATAVGEGYMLADPATGNVLWFGIVEEHGQPAYAGLRFGIEGQAIAEVESVIGREGSPAPFAPTAGYTIDPSFSRTVPEAGRLPRARLEALVTGYYASLQMNDGTVQTDIADDCRRQSNGFAT
jgi:hypothetical protein